jgi:hypothetical protein
MPKRIVALTPLLALLLLLATAAQTVSQPKKPAQSDKPMSQSINEDKLADLERRVKNLESRISSLSTRVAPTFVEVDCATRKYAELQFGTGYLIIPVLCHAIEPYLEGHRVTLKVGNPYSFDFKGVTGSLYYGKTLLDAFEKKVELSTTETLRSGAWTMLTVIVNPSKAEDMRSLYVELSVSTAAGAPR